MMAPVPQIPPAATATPATPAFAGSLPPAASPDLGGTMTDDSPQPVGGTQIGAPSPVGGTQAGVGGAMAMPNEGGESGVMVPMRRPRGLWEPDGLWSTLCRPRNGSQ